MALLRSISLVALLWAFSAIALPKTTTSGTVILRIIDGDTIKIRRNSKTENARLKFIDTPELRGFKCPQERTKALRAKARLAQILTNATTVSIKFYGRGYYNRPLITLKANGKDVGRTLLREKLAIPYKKGERHRRNLWCP